MHDAHDCDVLVAGAGPSGLTAALALAQHGVRVRIVDRGSGPVEEARAAIVHARTLELLDRLGVAEQAVARGLAITQVAIHERGRHVGRMPLAGEGTAAWTRFPYALALEQFETQQLLVDALAEHGVAVEWDTGVEDLADTGRGVRVGVRHGGAPGTVTARWLIGADGASSTVRRLLALDFGGRTYPQSGMLADVTLDVDLGVQGMRLNLTRGGFVGILPLASGRCRLFGVVPPWIHRGGDASQASHEAYAPLEPEVLHRWFADYFRVDAGLQDIVWASMFRFHSRIASRFRSGNCFLVGDAAHIHNPAGGQGLNLGIGDAVNLAWKLAQVTHGHAPAWLLDTYDAERRPVARAVLKRTDLGFRAETGNNALAVWMRTRVVTRVIGAVSRLAPVRRLFFHIFSQLWITYRGSRAVSRDASATGRLRPGDRAPYAPAGRGGAQGEGGGGRGVLELTHGGGYHLLCFDRGGDGPVPAVNAAELAEALDDRYPGMVAVHAVPPGETAAHHAYQVKGARLVLVRPDGHVGAVVDLPDGDPVGRLAGYLDEVLVRASAPSAQAQPEP
ncbi:FAD-dependent monooxygenase [Streptomyces sp. NPDC127068]|uniref:FAD-dependent monooxygenase n=1 Tax=Streptomyces sp. NPDC127068 TaxID=3347127 RepID=UPI003656C0CA